jgi:hypothetical protein
MEALPLVGEWGADRTQPQRTPRRNQAAEHPGFPDAHCSLSIGGSVGGRLSLGGGS